MYKLSTKRDKSRGCRRAVVAALALGAVAAGGIAHAGPERLHRKGLEEMRNGRYDWAESKLRRAYNWSKRERNGKPDPIIVTDYCKALVLGKQWRDATQICTEAASRAKTRKAEIARYRKRIAAAATLGKAELAAKWAGRALDGERYSDAVDDYRKAIKLYPRADFYLGLCKALSKQRKPGAALVACKKALAMKPDAATRTAARGMLGALAKAKASALGPAQQKAIAKLRRTVSDIQFLHPNRAFDNRKQNEYIATTQRCLDQVEAVRKSGVALKRTIRVHDVPRGIRVVRKEKKIVNGRFLGWWKLIRVSDMAGLCRRYNVKVKLIPVQRAVDRAAASMKTIQSLEPQKSTWKKLEKIEDINSIDSELNKAGKLSKLCIAAINRAASQKLAPSTMVDAKSAGRIALKDLESRLCQPLVARAARLRPFEKAARKAWYARKLRPFKKLLRRDKLRLVLRYNVHFMPSPFQGRHRNRLSTPRELRRARVWFQEVNRDCGAVKCWRLIRYYFRGHRLVRTTERQGWGAIPPRRAYR